MLTLHSWIDMDLNNSRSLFVVGDDAQSIYGFRGSKVEIILNFEHQYPGTKEITLNQNYRSTQPILDLAEQILTHNPRQKKKDLFTDNPEDVKVSYYLARNERDEAEYIIKKLYEVYCVSNSHKSSNGELTMEPTEFFDNPQMFQENEIQVEKSTDPISSMFDVYLDPSAAVSPSMSNYTPASWEVPTYNWKNCPQLNDVVVLYRTHSQSRSLEEAFLKHNVPYKLVSGVRFLDRKEIKDIVAMLKFLANGTDMLALSRFLPLLLDGVGPKTLQKIIAYLEDFEYPLAPKFQNLVVEFMTKFQSVWSSNTSLIDLTKELLTVSGYIRYLKGQYPVKEEFEARMENIGELYSLLLPFDEEKGKTLQEKLQTFLAHVTLMSSLDNDGVDDTPRISLMSLHQSKGLEFETVFLVGVEDGLLPHQNSFLEAGGMEEEVRLAYVGVTRAKKHLHLISADSRVQFGQIKANPVSRIFRPFLDSHMTRVAK